MAKLVESIPFRKILARAQAWAKEYEKSMKLSDFRYIVHVQHDDGSSYTFHNSFPVLFEKSVFIVFIEHHPVQFFPVEDLWSWDFMERMGKLPQVNGGRKHHFKPKKMTKK